MTNKEKKYRISIKVKLLGVIIPLMAVVVASLIIISYVECKRIITKSASSLLETSSKKQVNEIEAWLGENLAAFNSSKALIEDTALSDVQLQKFLDKYYGYNNNYPEGLYIADENGKLLKAQKSNKSDKDILNSVWYNEGLTRINMTFGTPYKNEAGKKVISASGILNDGSGKIKVISADVSLDKISIIVNSLIDMKNAESLLVNKNDKTVLAYEDSSLISTKLSSNNTNKFLSDVAVKLNNRQYNSCELQGNMVTFNQVQGTDWILVSYVKSKSILSDVSKLRNFMVLVAIISIMILVVLVERVVHIVIKPIRKLTDTIISMADGDFTVDVEVKGNDEISIMLKRVKEFIDIMRNMISNISSVSAQINGQANENITMSKELYDSSKLQSQSMESLNSTVDQLVASVNEVAENTTKLANVVTDTREDSANVDKKMKDTISVSEKGRMDAEKVNAAMDNIRNSITSLEEAINKVGKSSTEINDIINIIGSIAEQTNLLSLNASIEAARAGEAGKGFAVVAAEIGKLANTSTESVNNISKLVSEINSLVSDAVKQSHESVEHIEKNSYLISGTADSFDNIFRVVNEVNNLIQKMIEKIGHLDDVAASVAAISEEQAASSEEILATSEVMVNQANSIMKNSERASSDAEKLTNTSDELNNQVQMFKL